MAIQHSDLVRKEVALGVVRGFEPPNGFLYPTLTPWVTVQSDDVIFKYIAPQVSTLAPARAEDAESEMLERDDLVGLGRASIIDWAVKDHYVASDVSRWREYGDIAAQIGTDNFRMTVGAMTEDYQSKLARDTALRRQNIDNRLEKLAIDGLWTGQVGYNDGKVTFTVPFGRPAAQQNQAPAGGTWDLAVSDPIAAIEAMNDFMYDTYGFRLTKAYTSTEVLRKMASSDKFIARSGLVQTTTSSPVDPKYLIPGWGPAAAQAVIEAATGVQIGVYDGYYRSRPIGGAVSTVNRFADQRDIVFLPPDDVIGDLTDLGMGFAGMLTSPHAEGNFTPGFYAWERETVDPWGRDLGTGVKAFPLYPHLEYTYTMRVLP